MTPATGSAGEDWPDNRDAVDRLFRSRHGGDEDRETLLREIEEGRHGSIPDSRGRGRSGCRILLLDVDGVLLHPAFSAHSFRAALRAGTDPNADLELPAGALRIDAPAWDYGWKRWPGWFYPEVIAELNGLDPSLDIWWATSWATDRAKLDSLASALGLTREIRISTAVTPDRSALSPLGHTPNHWKARLARIALDTGAEVLWIDDQLSELALRAVVGRHDRVAFIAPLAFDVDARPPRAAGLTVEDMRIVRAFGKGRGISPDQG